ncbi:MAG: ABC transporter ATP-binding protein [Acidobacteria bacterium]|nr:ABC transporter ATP-binding protein [Acidobacteriota bacterium]MCH8267007.1 ABC transporter ATP-binding protein [Acidobacteriota bacterium]MCZ6491909.1 ABC transporter ATP-binding protein [Acidobacteriota bacterium]MCZ6752646.1 ABC transporter ATP-binding protein [Acidobacteriota bacterium]
MGEVEANLPPVVELIQASKSYRADGNVVHAVQGADLSLSAGSFTAIVGRSGCGKSTLLNLAGAVDLPTSGEVRIEQLSTSKLDDRDLSRLRRTRVGFIFQFFHLLPTLTVAENVELPLLLGLSEDGSGPQDHRRERVNHLLEMVGVHGKARHFPHQLSGGEMQRVAIARALINEPKIVIADEPTGNLDSANAEIVLRLLRQISYKMGHTVLMATHSLEAAKSASRVVSMQDGRLGAP